MYLKFLEEGSHTAVRAANFAVAALLVLVVAAPILAVGARIVA